MLRILGRLLRKSQTTFVQSAAPLSLLRVSVFLLRGQPRSETADEGPERKRSRFTEEHARPSLHPPGW